MKRYKITILLLLLTLITSSCYKNEEVKVTEIKKFEIEEVKDTNAAEIKKRGIDAFNKLRMRSFRDINSSRTRSSINLGLELEEDIESFEVLMLSEINEQRENYDARPLVINELLNNSALIKADIMNDAGEFSHKWIGYEDTFKITKELKRDNNEPWTVLGENLACGYTEVEEIVDAWMESAGHKKNLLDTRFFEMGVASRTLIKKEGGTCLNVVLHLGG